MKAPKEIIKIGQLELRFFLDGDDTDNQMVTFEFIVPPGAKVPVPHYHVGVDEMLYGLEGTMSSIIDGKKLEINPGDSVFIKRGLTHYHDNLGDTTAKVLCVLTPASIGPAYFRELAAIIQPGLPPDPQKAAEIMLRHGLVLSLPQ
jgi:quercetin dioxygenase-like cupin family protein